VAAKHLARKESRVITVCGCGVQADAQLRALRRVLPVERVLAYDRDGCRADQFADDLSTASDLDAHVAAKLGAAARGSDVCVTCTTSRKFLLGRDDVRPGTFVAAVGVDSPEKREIHPDLMAAAKVVVDDLEQCAAIGDLHHALDAGAMTGAEVHADLAAVVAGRARGRTSRDEITLFDSTGIALEDAAAAALVFERALLEGGCRSVQLAG
jgi:ornithine cyclodeaminase/alanine dehydrogenase-like protein (mu-crystallin family)